MEGRADYLEPSGFSSYFYILNGRRSPLDRRELREFLIGSIDRDKLLEELGGGPRLKAFSLIPPGLAAGRVTNAFPGGGARPEGFAGDTAESIRRAADESRSDPLVLICPSDRGHVVSARALARQLAEVTGLTIELRPLEGREFFRARREGDFHLASGGWSFSSPDPLALLLQFLPGALYGGSGGRAFEKACVAILSEGGDAHNRRALIKEAEQELLTGEALILPLFFGSRPQLLRTSSWRGLAPTGWYPPRLSRLHRL
jgi:ABC-type oligopeptide transport system substrate-binding subunit